MESRPHIPLERVLESTGGTVVKPGSARAFERVVIDGRAAGPGTLFFAIRGDRFDGVDFAPQAVAAGATGVVVPRGRGAAIEGATVIEVDDTIAALGQLGRAHRLSMKDLKVVAITGSNGKTTTKEMVASILRA